MGSLRFDSDGRLPHGLTVLTQGFLTDRFAHLTPQLCTITNFVSLMLTMSTTLRYAHAVSESSTGSWSHIGLD